MHFSQTCKRSILTQERTIIDYFKKVEELWVVTEHNPGRYRDSTNKREENLHGKIEAGYPLIC